MPENVTKPKKYFSFKNFFTWLIGLIRNKIRSIRRGGKAVLKDKNTDIPFCHSKDDIVEHCIFFGIKSENNATEDILKTRSYKKKMEILKSNLFIDVNIFFPPKTDFVDNDFIRLENKIKNNMHVFGQKFIDQLAFDCDDVDENDHLLYFCAMKDAIDKANFDLKKVFEKEAQKMNENKEISVCVCFVSINEEPFSFNVYAKAIRKNSDFLENDFQLEENETKLQEECDDDFDKSNENMLCPKADGKRSCYLDHVKIQDNPTKHQMIC